MKSPKIIGILALQGDVDEHVAATEAAAKKLRLPVTAVLVRTQNDLTGIAGLIMPGGESTVLETLTRRANIFESLKNIPCIFGTCAGAIMLAKNIEHAASGQKTLGLMDITVDRNAYGRQTDSFETTITTEVGSINAIFIRAPRILKISSEIHVLARLDEEVVACEQRTKDNFYLAACFHPELTTTLFHEYFLKQVFR